MTHAQTSDGLAAVADAVVEAADAAGVGFVVTITGQRGEPTYRYVSDTAARILGYPRAELLGRPVLDFIEPEIASGYREIIRQRLRGQAVPLQYETTAVRKDGRRVPIEASLSFVDIDGEPGEVIFIIDRSERERARKALRDSRDRFERLVESLPEAVWIFDGNTLRFANGASARLLGYQDARELIGKDPREFVHPDDWEPMVRRTRQLFSGTDRLPPQEYRTISRDGTVVVTEVSSIAFEYDGNPAVLGFARDVTERKSAEAQLLQADRLAALGTLAGGMAHAINNPLTYVLLNLEHMDVQLPKIVRDKRQLAEAMVRLREAHDGAERVSGVVSRLRRFARPDTEPGAPGHVRLVLDNVLDLLGNELKHRARVETDIADMPVMRGPRARLEQLFLHLILAVARSLPEGGERENVIRILAQYGDGKVTVTLEDDGPGFGAIADDIFDPFSRRASEVGTTLTICKSLVSSMSGRIVVSERDGGGNRVIVELPADVAGRERDAPSSNREPRAAASGPARVLVIDDDRGVASAVSEMLRQQHDVTMSETPRGALRTLLEDSDYDVVFCDLYMPELSGRDLYEALRLNRPGLERRIVFMSAVTFTDDAREFLGSIPNAVLEKPFSVDQLEGALLAALGLRRS